MGFDPHSFFLPARREERPSGRSLFSRPPFLFEQSLSLPMNRRRFLSLTLGAAAGAGLMACAAGADDDVEIDESQPLPTEIPAGTELRLSGLQNQRLLEWSGFEQDLSFPISDWVNISGGPDVINAFRAGSVDLASNAGIPPIQAHYMGGINAKIVAVRLTRVPIYVFATRPGSDIESVADFRGKRLAFSEGQAQGVVLLRALAQEGIPFDEVELVPLNSPQFLVALQGGQVDIAPLGITGVYQYLNQYERDGARQIPTDVVDRLAILWAPGRVLADDAKVAAIAEYIPLWAKAAVWQWENQEEWIQKWFVESEGVTYEQGRAVMDISSKPYFPPNWDEAQEWEQETIELLAEGGYVDSFDAEVLFDRRFEPLASTVIAESVAEEYRVES